MKTISYLIVCILISSGNVFSDISDTCHKGTSFDQYVEHQCNEGLKLNWHAASGKNVQDANCRGRIPTASSIKKMLQENFSVNRDLVTTEINGIKITDENPELVKHFKDLLETRERYRYENLRPDLQQDFQE